MARVKHDWLVYSTQTNSTDYGEWERSWEGTGENRKPNGPAKFRKIATINGGANLATKRVVTPLGVMTGISNDQYEFLKQCPEFLRHVKAKHLIVLKGTGWPDDPDDIAANELKSKDRSAPLDAQYYAERGKKPPTVGSSDGGDDAGTVIPTKQPRRRKSPAASSDPLRR